MYLGAECGQELSVIVDEIRKLGRNSRRQIEVIKKSVNNIEDFIKIIYELHLYLLNKSII